MCNPDNVYVLVVGFLFICVPLFHITWTEHALHPTASSLACLSAASFVCGVWSASILVSYTCEVDYGRGL